MTNWYIHRDRASDCAKDETGGDHEHVDNHDVFERDRIQEECCDVGRRNQAELRVDRESDRDTRGAENHSGCDTR